MPRVTPEHVVNTRKAVILVERATNRGITDTLACLQAMQGERTDARVFINDQTIGAMQLMAESLDLQLKSQARISAAHGVMKGLIQTFDVPGYGPSECVPNTPGGGISAVDERPLETAERN